MMPTENNFVTQAFREHDTYYTERGRGGGRKSIYVNALAGERATKSQMTGTPICIAHETTGAPPPLPSSKGWRKKRLASKSKRRTLKSNARRAFKPPCLASPLLS